MAVIAVECAGFRVTEGDDDETLAFGCAHSNQTASGTSAAKPLDELLYVNH
jgi:hypothetical protein